MSHFTCLVIGDDPEEALAPYDENSPVDPYKEYWDSDDYVHWEAVLQKPSEDAEHPILNAEYTLEDMLHVFLARYYPGEPWGETGFDIDDGGIFRWSTYNPKSKWDWWVIGGRWRGYFKVKAGSLLALVGEAGVFDNVAFYDADQALKGDVDIDWMRDEAGNKAAATWDRVFDVIDGLPEAQSWESFTGRWKLNEITIEEARDLYNQQERVVALKEWNNSLPEDEKVISPWGDTGVEDFQMPRDAFVSQARDNALCPYAYVHQGEWHAPGKMGWWATSTDTKADRVRFAREFNELLDSLPDDTLLTLCDLHI